MRFDIKDGLCSPNNVKSLYNFIDNVGKDAIFANASRMEQILSDMEQGNEPTVSGKDAIININNKARIIFSELNSEVSRLNSRYKTQQQHSKNK